MIRNLLILPVMLVATACTTLIPGTPSNSSQQSSANTKPAIAADPIAGIIQNHQQATAKQANPSALNEQDTAPALENAGAESNDTQEETAANEPGNIWDRIRNGMSMPDIDNPRVDQQLSWYVRNEEYMDRVVEHATPYMHFIVEYLEKEQIPLEIALLPIVESAFQPFAYSHGRASGIWQFIPSTGKMYGLEQNWWYDGRRDIHAATIAAVKLLSSLRDEFKGDWMLALAAYNSGSYNVNRAIRLNQRKGKPTDFFSLKLPRETRDYVPKLLALKKIVADPARYKLDLDPIADEPYFERVELDSQIDLALVAKLSGLDLDSVYRLNPAFNRWATAPNGPHHLLLPIENAQMFRVNLAEYPAEKRIQWVRHQVQKGDTIKKIAVRYQTTSEVISTVNKLKDNRLSPQQSLMIPVASQSLSSYKLSAAQRLQTLQNTPQNDGVKVNYTVHKGDTWWKIAHRHQVGVKQLARWNGLAPRDQLMPGQQLVIWSRAAKQAAAEPEIDESQFTKLDDILLPDQRTMVQRIGYQVRRGDSLYAISRKFNVSVDQLKRWNQLSAKSRLRVGQRLTLFVDIRNTTS